MNTKKLTFTVDPSDETAMQRLMDELGDSDTLFEGSNEEMEDVTVSIAKDRITVQTFQANGWVRRNVYWRDGTREELFEGRWRQGSRLE